MLGLEEISPPWGKDLREREREKGRESHNGRLQATHDRRQVTGGKTDFARAELKFFSVKT